MLEKVQASSKINIHYIRQKEPKGLGHAVWCARKFIEMSHLRCYLVMILSKAKHHVYVN